MFRKYYINIIFEFLENYYFNQYCVCCSSVDYTWLSKTYLNYKLYCVCVECVCVCAICNVMNRQLRIKDQNCFVNTKNFHRNKWAFYMTYGFHIKMVLLGRDWLIHNNDHHIQEDVNFGHKSLFNMNIIIGQYHIIFRVEQTARFNLCQMKF